MTAGRVVIAGGGLAAVRTAQALRDVDHQGEIVLLSEENELPYDRPPLSKEMLLGTFPEEALRLLEADGYADLDVQVRLEHRVVGVDTSARRLRVAGRDDVPYDNLVVATGSRPRRLASIPDAADVHVLRTAQNSRALAGQLREGARVVVVGAGFIGLEVASSALARGCEVTVVEAAERPLAHALGPQVAHWLQTWHAERGVSFHCGLTAAATAQPTPDARLELSDGSTLAADVVVVGVGIERATGWLAEAGLQVDGGLVCDQDGRASLPGVFAAGDIVCRTGPAGATLIGHWTAAADSAGRAARALVGAESAAVTDEAYFWSNQTELRLQAVGNYRPEAITTLVDGELASGKFVAHYEVDGELIGAVAANNPRGFLASRKALRELLG